MSELKQPGKGEVLVVNAGSSSLKLKLLPSGHSLLIERLGGPTTVRASFALIDAPRLERFDHAFDFALGEFAKAFGELDLAAVGHRVVHGGTRFLAPVVLDDAVESAVEDLNPLAPLHNPGNLEAARAARRALPDVEHVAVFDTAFHGSLPPRAYLYGLPLQYAERGIRRYGFHGTSHQYVSARAAELLGRPLTELKIVTLHLGNGASAAAVSGGQSVDTTMGLTPMEGLLMGTRAGDIDSGLLLHLLREGMTVVELDELLNRNSGLKGMSGVSNDMRDVRAAALKGVEGAQRALELFAHRVRKTVGALAASMGGLDAVAFAGGIGENDPLTRASSLSGLEFMGIEVDGERNVSGGPRIDAEGSRVSVLVVQTDEEQLIAEQARKTARAPERSASAQRGKEAL